MAAVQLAALQSLQLVGLKDVSNCSGTEEKNDASGEEEKLSPDESLGTCKKEGCTWMF